MGISVSEVSLVRFFNILYFFIVHRENFPSINHYLCVCSKIERCLKKSLLCRFPASLNADRSLDRLI